MRHTVLEVLPPRRRSGQEGEEGDVVAVFGTFIEYYDFSVYGYVAATLAVVFFPTDDPMIGLLNTLLVFGAGVRGPADRRDLLRPARRPQGPPDQPDRQHHPDGRRGRVLTGLLPGYAADRGLGADPAGRCCGSCRASPPAVRSAAPPATSGNGHAPNRRPLYISFIPSVAQLGKGAGRRHRRPDRRCASVRTGDGVLGLADPVPARPPAGRAVPVHAAAGRGQPRVRRGQGQGPHHRQAHVKACSSNYRAPLVKVIADRHRAEPSAPTSAPCSSRSTSPMFWASPRAPRRPIVLLAVLLAAVLIPLAGLLGTAYRRQTDPGDLLRRLRPASPSRVPADEPGHSVGLAMLGLASA